MNPRAGAKLSAAGHGGGDGAPFAPTPNRGPGEIFAHSLSEKQKPCYAPYRQDHCREAGRDDGLRCSFGAGERLVFRPRPFGEGLGEKKDYSAQGVAITR